MRGKGCSWRHSSGWEVHHCGGHSALWPYWLKDPAHPGDATFSESGKGFLTAKIARRVVEALAAGRVETSDENCAPGVRVVVGVSPSGMARRSAVRQ